MEPRIGLCKAAIGRIALLEKLEVVAALAREPRRCRRTA